MRCRYLAIGLLMIAGCGAAGPNTPVPENVVSSPASSSEIGKSDGVAYSCDHLVDGECCFHQATSDGCCTTWPVTCGCWDGSTTDGYTMYCCDGTSYHSGGECPVEAACGDGACNGVESCCPGSHTYCPADCGTCYGC
jgi:hypothetical protein